MSPLGWHPPHLVDNTDTHYLGDQHWQQCWFFRFFFLFCVHLFDCQSVSVHLFTISSFWKLTTIDQLVYICEPGFRATIKRDDCVCIRILRNFSEKLGGGIIVRIWVRTASAATINTCLFCWTCVCYSGSMKFLFSLCPVISLCFCLFVINYVTIQLQYYR